MAAQFGSNQKVHVLDELVCQAIPGPTESAVPPAASKGEQRTPDWSADNTHSIEVVLDRDFASYSAVEQEQLLASIKQMLIVAGEVRVTKRTSVKRSA